MLWVKPGTVPGRTGEEHHMGSLVRFMATGAGRGLRVVAGVALGVAGGMLGGGWWALTAVGVVFVVVGAANVCLLAPLAGLPVRGSQVR